MNDISSKYENHVHIMQMKFVHYLLQSKEDIHNIWNVRNPINSAMNRKYIQSYCKSLAQKTHLLTYIMHVEKLSHPEEQYMVGDMHRTYSFVISFQIHTILYEAQYLHISFVTMCRWLQLIEFWCIMHIIL